MYLPSLYAFFASSSITSAELRLIVTSVFIGVKSSMQKCSAKLRFSCLTCKDINAISSAALALEPMRYPKGTSSFLTAHEECKSSKASLHVRFKKCSLTLSIEFKIISISSPVIAFVAGASPTPTCPFSSSTCTLTNSTCEVSRSAVLNGVFSSMYFISVSIFVIFILLINLLLLLTSTYFEQKH